MQIADLMSKPELTKIMGVAGRERAKALFGWDQVARETFQLYRSVIK
jgi:glycosyltransferase involved in cell wall biosynthesis